MLGLGHVFAQDRQSNVKKYWVYRERFFKYFISTNEGNKKGTNIPATLIKTKILKLQQGQLVKRPNRYIMAMGMPLFSIILAG